MNNSKTTQKLVVISYGKVAKYMTEIGDTTRKLVVTLNEKVVKLVGILNILSVQLSRDMKLKMESNILPK